MSESDDTTTTTHDSTAAHVCSMSLEEHIEIVMAALTTFGLGMACETEYHALLILAETGKLLHGHRDFDPRPAAEALVRQALALRAKIAAAPAVGSDVFPAPDNHIVH